MFTPSVTVHIVEVGSIAAVFIAVTHPDKTATITIASTHTAYCELFVVLRWSGNGIDIDNRCNGI